MSERKKIMGRVARLFAIGVAVVAACVLGLSLLNVRENIAVLAGFAVIVLALGVGGNLAWKVWEEQS